MLYAANTAGAVAGTLLTAFFLIPRFGVFNSSLVAAGINLAAASGAFAFRWLDPTEIGLPIGAATREPRPGSRLALALYAVAGGIALGYEVIWTQVVVQWTSTRAFAFAVVLAVYLTGLVVGSACLARRADRVTDPWGWFGFLISAAGVLALLQVLLIGEWLQPLQVVAATGAFKIMHSESVAMAARFVVAAACVVLLPTLLLARVPDRPETGGRHHPRGPRFGHHPGGEHPRRDRRDARDRLPPHPESGVGTRPRGPGRRGRGRGGDRCLDRWKTGENPPLGDGRLWDPRHCVRRGHTPDHLARLLAASRKGTLLFSKSGARRHGRRRRAAIRCQHVSTALHPGSVEHGRFDDFAAIYAPAILAPASDPSRGTALSPGDRTGHGITAGSLLPFQGLDRRVCAELLPEVATAASLFKGNHDVTADPADRNPASRRSARVDAIRRGLRPDHARATTTVSRRSGQPLLARLLHLGRNAIATGRAVGRSGCHYQRRRSLTHVPLKRSFLDVFPHATLWTTELHEMMLVGSLAPIELDAARIATRFNQPGVSTALERSVSTLLQPYSPRSSATGRS